MIASSERATVASGAPCYKRRVMRIAVLVLAIGGCDREPTTPAPDPIEQRWAREDLHKCEQLISTALRARYLPGLVPSVGPHAFPTMVSCRFAPPGIGSDAWPLAHTRASGVDVTYTCGLYVNAEETLRRVRETYASGKPIPGLGKFAVHWDPQEARVFDRDCELDVFSWDHDTVELLRALHRELLAGPPGVP